MMNLTSTTVIVFSADIARKLLRDGYRIVDIKPDKFDEDNKRTLFVFANDGTILQAIKNIKTAEE